MYNILIKSDSRYPLDRKKIRHKLQQALQKHKINRKLEISINIVGTRKMKTLNKEYRKIDKPTNVLSFPLEQVEKLPQNTTFLNQTNGTTQTENVGFVFPNDKTLYLGDIVICYPVARQQSAEYYMFVNDWISDLAVHGLQHLLGIHHNQNLELR